MGLFLYAGIPAFCKHLNRFTVDYCQIPAATSNSNKYESDIVHLIFLIFVLSLVFYNKQLNYVHCRRSHALTVVPGRPDAQNGNNPDTIARRKSSVIPSSVMPLRENEKVIPRNPCLNPHPCAAARNTQDIRYVRFHAYGTVHHSPWENGGTPSCQT